MDTDPKLLAAVEGVTEAYNNLSEAFIKFSLAYAQISQRVKEIHDADPTIFTD